MNETDLAEEDRAAIRAALLAHRAEGVRTPQIPLNFDVDGDGRTDAWGLDESDEVVLVPHIHVAETTFVADGDGTEGGAA